MQIVDAQIHVWSTGLPSNQAHWQVTSFSTEQALRLMDEAAVDAAVIHPPSWDPDSVTMALDAVRDYPGRFAVMGSLPLEQADSRERIASWKEQLGLRYTVLKEPTRTWLHDGTLDWLFSWVPIKTVRGSPALTAARLTVFGERAHAGQEPLFISSRGSVPRRGGHDLRGPALSISDAP